jgi:hypothetical protein
VTELSEAWQRTLNGGRMGKAGRINAVHQVETVPRLTLAQLLRRETARRNLSDAAARES